jgi:hypothetical protein
MMGGGDDWLVALIGAWSGQRSIPSFGLHQSSMSHDGGQASAGSLSLMPFRSATP